MKCPDCNQQIIDKKTFCPNCGKQLNNPQSQGVNSKKLLLIFAVAMILIGIGSMYMVANVGTKAELEKLTSNKKETVKDFYGNYIIKDIITTENSNKTVLDMKENIIGYEVELTKDKFKLGIFGIVWSKLSEPKFNLNKDISKYKDDLSTMLNDGTVLTIEGKNSLEQNSKDLSFKMVNLPSALYLYYENTYYKLERSKLNFKSSDTFYKVVKFEQKYKDSINDIINSNNERAKNNVEQNKYQIYENYIEEYKDNDITHLVFHEMFGVVNSEGLNNIKTVSFNENEEILDLKTYIEHINKDYEEIIKKYETLKKDLIENSSTEIKFETNENLMYYVSDNVLKIICGKDQFGSISVSINLEG